MRRRIVSAFFIASITALNLYAQVQLHSFYSRSVSEGYSVQTKIDSLLVDTKVNNGLAVTSLTMVITPGKYGNIKEQRRDIPVSDTTILIDEIGEPAIISSRSVDSIEMRISFRLPTDFVADKMWLWVEGEKVSAQIQDRALASAQYNEIVGVRRDPALLETWGNGSYNLRIFPASSMRSRKVQIEFHHTMDDDSASLITACVPVTYDTTNVRYYYGYLSFDKSIGFVEAAFTTDDNETYTVEFPGVGEGTFSAGSPLALTADKVVKIDVAAIYIDDHSGGDEFLWVGKDAVDGNMNAGLALELTDASMRFEDEPDTRVIAIDMRNTMWDWNEYYTKRYKSYNPDGTHTYANYQVYNVWERAQKYAILALRQYLQNGQKFNVLIGGKQVHSVFDAPVDVTTENLNAAIDAIVAAAASPEASTEDMASEILDQTEDGIVVLISDLFQPYDYYARIDDKITISEKGTAYNELMEKLSNMIVDSDITLFSICDNSQLTAIARRSGGYQLAGVLNRYNIAFEYKVVDGRRVAVPFLPPLFGSSNNSGITDLEVSSSVLDEIVYSSDGYYLRYYLTNGGGFATDGAEIAVPRVLAKMTLPSYNNGTSLFMRIAGRLPDTYSGEHVPVVISGKMGGLKFNQNIESIPFSSSGSENSLLSNPQWAFRKCEQLSYNNYVKNAPDIKNIGKEYHIVTRQTSLLALEPGMELWEDSTWQQEDVTQTPNDATTGGFGATAEMGGASRDYTEAGTAPTTTLGDGVELDGISLDDLLLERDISVVTMQHKATRFFSARVNGSMVTITFPLLIEAEKVTIRLFDLKGRLVQLKTFNAEKVAGSQLQLHLARKNGIGAGMYTMHISAGTINKVIRLPYMNR